MGFASYMLGLATGFLVCAIVSFSFSGLFGTYYLAIGSVSAGASVVVTLMGARRAANLPHEAANSHQ
ncbi:MAG: hypothetical protein ACYC2H_06950 [Thermoplasmatota archaeon]